MSLNQLGSEQSSRKPKQENEECDLVLSHTVTCKKHMKQSQSHTEWLVETQDAFCCLIWPNDVLAPSGFETHDIQLDQK